MGESLLDLTVAEFLDAVAEETPAPGGGGVAAVVTALAAGLAGMAARFSEAKQPGVFTADAQRADALRTEVAALADADAAAYGGYLAAVRLPKEPDPQARSAAIRAAADASADVPLAIVTAAAEVAELAVRLAREGTRRLRSDAAAAAVLAAGAAAAAARLVQENLAGTPEDPRLQAAADLCARAAAAAVQARDGQKENA